MRANSIDKNLYFFKHDWIDNNTFIFIEKDEAVIIDPSFNFDKIKPFLETNNIKKIVIMITHGHHDHVGDTLMIEKHFETKIFISKKEKDFLMYEKNSSRNFGINLMPLSSKISYFEDFEKFTLGELSFTFKNFPGHSIGSTVIYHDNYVFTGDFIFAEEIGRMDLLSGSEEQMVESIKRFHIETDDQKLIMPGHGGWALFGEVKKNNPEYIEYLNKKIS